MDGSISAKTQGSVHNGRCVPPSLRFLSDRIPAASVQRAKPGRRQGMRPAGGPAARFAAGREADIYLQV
jgi:hypothetical protein